ncbi:murein biosynthesis integral membrane protein MurJ [Kitasatospora sp. NPDC052896]|uniref:murein biosynthesis integral membrane protein MurJ n=1 Tax=Kitasatospora sp. NPDC052896 TaxID=3364061 RepID=UPI0037C9AEAD
MTTHTSGEPYGSYGPPESYGSPGAQGAYPQETAYQQGSYPQQDGYGQQGGYGTPEPYGSYGPPTGYGPAEAQPVPPQQRPAPVAPPAQPVRPPHDDQPTMALRPIPAQGFGPADSSYAPPAEQLPSQRGPAEQPAPQQEQPGKAASDGRNGLIMALGTLASRGLGFVRASMIVAALATGPLGDSFNVANSLPNTVYMMLLGGVLASVFVPELVHAAQTHKDGGVAYTDRLLTICLVALVILTAATWLFAPMVVDLYSHFPGPQRELTIAFARCCLPQIFFYGVFTLLGQVLNARDNFGAMMWAPVLNNVVSIAVFGLYIATAHGVHDIGRVTSGQVALLGWGSTLGILVQTLGLIPALRKVGFRWRPRFDWRGAGLTKPLRSATWALLLVLVTQLAFAVITQLSTGAGTLAEKAGIKAGLGNFAYTNAYNLFVMPQGVITISLVTAILPRMARSATAGRLQEIGADISQVLKNSAGMIMTATVLFVALASQICNLAYLHGAATPGDTWVIAQLLIAFAIGLPAFCAQYALARGFYALGDARTPFWLTVVSSGTNAALSAVAYFALPPRWIVIGMAFAQSVACVVNVVITGRALGRRLRRGAPVPPEPAPTGSPEETMVLRTPVTTPPIVRTGRSGLDGRRVFGLHLGLLLACLPGAFVGHWLAAQCNGLLGFGIPGNLVALGVGSVAVLASLFLLARVFGAGSAVAPLARKLRIPYPEPAVLAGKHRR